MIKDIKFKLYTRDINGVWAGNEQDSSAYIDMTGNLWVLDDFGHTLPNPFLDDDFVVCLNSTFFDKHGVEIYDGDILTTDTENAINWVCKFEIGAFLFYRVGYESEGGYGFRPDLFVIGNVYENQNLIKDTK